MQNRFNGWSRILLGSALVLAGCFMPAATVAAHRSAALGAEEPTVLDPNQALGREIFEDIISRRTAAGHGQVPTMAESLAERSGLYAPEDDIRAHGRDERIRVDAFYGALDHWYVLLQAIAGPDQAIASGKRADKGGRTGR